MRIKTSLLALLLINCLAVYSASFKLPTVYTTTYKRKGKPDKIKYNLKLKPIEITKEGDNIKFVNSKRKGETTEISEETLTVAEVTSFVTFVDEFIKSREVDKVGKEKAKKTLFTIPKRKTLSLFYMLKDDSKRMRKDGMAILIAGKIYNIDKSKLNSLSRTLKSVLKK